MGQFPSTHWSLIDQAGAVLEVSRNEALAALVNRYLPALRIHLLARQGIAHDRADDLLQGFLADEVLGGGLLKNADSRKGKFRSLLLTALDRYVIGQRRYWTRQKRYAGNGVSIDEAPEPCDPGAIAPETAFELAWARQVLDAALEQMAAQCREKDRSDVWGVFDARILAPLVRGEPPPAYEVMVERFGITSATQASNLLVTGKRMFARSLRQVIGEYEENEAEIDSEIQELQRILAHGARS